MRRLAQFVAAVAALALLASLLPSRASSPAVDDAAAIADGRRSLRVANYLDPKTTVARTDAKVTITIYLTLERRDLNFPDNFNEALSIFKTDILQRYGTGRVQYMIRERAACDAQCGEGEPGPLLRHEPCLAVSRHSKRMLCDIDRLRCSYPKCKTMVTNDEFCTKIDLPFDAREYYTSDRPGMGYLPIGPRYDSWQSFRQIQQSNHNFFVAPASTRKYAFNAIFSRSTNSDRKKLATDIEQRGRKSQWPIFTAMAEQWQRDANDAETDQLSTHDYITVVLDSIFTLSPAGHSPECFRLFEAVEAGSIPVMSKDDLRGTRHPDWDKGARFKDQPHPCKDSLHHWYDAPIVVLETWDDLFPTLEKLLSNPAELNDMQLRLQIWYDRYMRRVVGEFEDFMLDASPPGHSTGIVPGASSNAN